jgi:predicted Zn-ribbon and HTH transcriptional regulator
VQTSRQAIAEYLREQEATPSELAAELDETVEGVLTDVEHVANTLAGTGEQVVVQPPQCRECDFDRFDTRLNVPSRCPECRSERITEPVLRVR